MKSGMMRAAATTVLLLGVAGGCGGKQQVEARTATTGQELQDLEAARDKGLLTEKEYQRERQEILKRK